MQSTPARQPMSTKDTAAGYGWVSIALHWITAIWIIVLLFLGNTIETLSGDERQVALIKHTSIAMSGYGFLLARIVWRFYSGHPNATEEQRGFTFTLGTWVHTVILVALILMLLSGPLMVWSGGSPIVVFDWFRLATPLPTSPAANSFFHSVHTWSALAVFICTLLHFIGVYKHTAFNQDGTLTRILIADRQSSNEKGS